MKFFKKKKKESLHAGFDAPNITIGYVPARVGMWQSELSTDELRLSILCTYHYERGKVIQNPCCSDWQVLQEYTSLTYHAWTVHINSTVCINLLLVFF
uniref:Uncharacterized protein n=1 Tax=Rhizophora mucronata TaxID=61149 RepID=A0A2P2PN94_RHIMU